MSEIVGFKVNAVAVGGKRVVIDTRQLFLAYGEYFSVTFQVDNIGFFLRFYQEFDKEQPGPYLKRNREGDGHLGVTLGNFDQLSVITGTIPFCHDAAGKIYSFQLSAVSIDAKADKESIWLYTIVFSEEMELNEGE